MYMLVWADQQTVRLGEATAIESHSAELLPAPWRQGRGTCNEKDKKCGSRRSSSTVRVVVLQQLSTCFAPSWLATMEGSIT
jgi:hypothetical protein